FFWLYRDAIRKRAVSAYEFSVQRFSRLYPLHLVTLVLVALLQALYFSREQKFFVYPNNDPFHFILNLGFASNWGLEKGLSFNGPVWSVSVEILLYLLFFIVALMGRGGWIFCVVVSMVASGLHVVTGHGVFTGAAMFFLGGGVYHLTRWITGVRPWIAPVVGGVTLAMWVGVLVHFYGFDLFHLASFLKVPDRILAIGFQNYLLFPLTICSLALLGIHRAGAMRSVSWIGDITYSSYLIHFPMQLILGLAVSYGILGRDFYKAPVSLIAFFVFLVPVSYWVYRKFEWPMQRWIRRRCIRSSDRSD
ncbi:MAG TPA: acyltransferase, partial [Bacteroidia bacterium]|nr:acyltransferase [Bacteroidia bacterium]